MTNKARRELKSFGGETVDEAAFVEFFVGEFQDPDNVSGHEYGLIVGRIGDGDVDRCHLIVALAAFEADSSPGHIFAGDNVIGKAGTANASLVVSFHAGVLAAICVLRFGFRLRGLCGWRRRG